MANIQQQIGFQELLHDYPEEKNLLVQIRNTIAEKMIDNHATITTKNFSYSTEQIHETFKTLNHDHIEYLLDCLRNNPKKNIRNMRQYLLVTLMNVQVNYEGYKLNQRKDEKLNDVVLDEKFSKKKLTDDEIKTNENITKQVLESKTYNTEVGKAEENNEDDVFSQSFSAEDYEHIFGTIKYDDSKLSRSEFWELYKNPADSRTIDDLNNGELAEITNLMKNEDLIQSLKAKN